MDTPTNSVMRFGVRTLGKGIEWGYVDPVTKELGTMEFHPKVGVTFEEILEFQAARAELVRDLRAEARRMQEAVNALDPEDPEMPTKAEEITRGNPEAERERFERQVDTVLMLIVDEERPRMEPLLRQGHPNEIRELLNHLQSVVITKTEKRVEAVANVDPTSPPVPVDSSSTEESGPDSESKPEPTSET
jgi:hypothetical protein